MGFAGNCCLKHLSGVTDRHIGCRIAYALDVVEVTVCVTGFTFGGFTEVARYFWIAFNVRLLCEIEVTTVRL